jgi:hypothetical protein
LRPGSFDFGMPAPIEAASRIAFDNEVVGSRSLTSSHTDLDLPLGRGVEVSDGKDWLAIDCGVIRRHLNGFE